MIDGKPDILSTMEREGIGLKQRGRDFWACCPFHPEKSPSFKVSASKQSFYCFGCHEHGDVVTFTMKHHGVNFKEALTILGIRNGKPPKPDPAKERRRALLRAFDQWRQDRYQVLCQESINIHELRIKAQRRLTPLPEAAGWLLAAELSRLPDIEDRLDILAGGDPAEIFALYEAENNG